MAFTVGSTNGIVTLSYSTVPTRFSIGIRAYKTSYGGGSLGRFFNKQDGTVEDKLLFTLSIGGISTVQYNTDATGGDGRWQWALPADEQWFSLHLVHNTASYGYPPDLYINGNFTSIASTLKNPTGVIINGAGMWTVGNRISDFARHFGGRLADFSIRDRLMEAGEIWAEAQGLSPQANPRGLVAYVPLLRDVYCYKGHAVSASNAAVADHARVFYGDRHTQWRYPVMAEVSLPTVPGAGDSGHLSTSDGTTLAAVAGVDATPYRLTYDTVVLNDHVGADTSGQLDGRADATLNAISGVAQSDVRNTFDALALNAIAGVVPQGHLSAIGEVRLTAFAGITQDAAIATGLAVYGELSLLAKAFVVAEARADLQAQTPLPATAAVTQSAHASLEAQSVLPAVVAVVDSAQALLLAQSTLPSVAGLTSDWTATLRAETSMVVRLAIAQDYQATLRADLSLPATVAVSDESRADYQGQTPLSAIAAVSGTAQLDARAATALSASSQITMISDNIIDASTSLLALLELSESANLTAYANVQMTAIALTAAAGHAFGRADLTTNAIAAASPDRYGVIPADASIGATVDAAGTATAALQGEAMIAAVAAVDSLSQLLAQAGVTIVSVTYVATNGQLGADLLVKTPARRQVVVRVMPREITVLARHPVNADRDRDIEV